MSEISLQAWLFACYSVGLVVVSWLFDVVSRRSAKRSAEWRTGNFVYHEDSGAWKCHEDQWLWPVAFDPDKRVVRYQGQHAICGRCPAKASCSPTPGPRELTRAVDPWPHSETGRFHRGIALAVGVLAVVIALVQLCLASSLLEALLLGAVLLLALASAVPLARHLWNEPVDYPEHVPLAGGSVPLADPVLRQGADREPVDLEALIDRHARSVSGRPDKRARESKETRA